MSLGKYITASALAFSVSANSYGHQSEVTLKDDEIARIIYSPEFKRRPPTTARYFGLTQSSVQTIKSLGPEMSTAVQDIMNTTSRKYELPSFDRQMADYYQTALSQPITSVVSRRTQSLQIDKPPINLRPYFGLSRETCSTIR